MRPGSFVSWVAKVCVLVGLAQSAYAQNHIHVDYGSESLTPPAERFADGADVSIAVSVHENATHSLVTTHPTWVGTLTLSGDAVFSQSGTATQVGFTIPENAGLSNVLIHDFTAETVTLTAIETSATSLGGDSADIEFLAVVPPVPALFTWGIVALSVLLLGVALPLTRSIAGEY